MRLLFKPYIAYLLRLTWLPLVLLFTGCTAIGPDYVRPDTSLPTAWHSELKGGLIAEEVNPQTLAAWWSTLNDPELSSLIERAVIGNLDLKNAMARVREARACRGIAKADLFPTLDATGSASWSRSSNKDTDTTSELYSAGFDSNRGSNNDQVLVNQSYLDKPRSLIDAVKEIQNMAAIMPILHRAIRLRQWIYWITL
ncbi:TolC family protein [Dissulfurispira sp.]|uniref:TolC family protein n=1 Tax=Dissulfurispira sp. TaxID=2817609 RepID=UPI002FD8DDD4